MPSRPAMQGTPSLLVGPTTASLVGTSGFAAIPTTALDLPLVQRLRRSPRFWVRVPKSINAIVAASPRAGADEKGQKLHSQALKALTNPWRGGRILNNLARPNIRDRHLGFSRRKGPIIMASRPLPKKQRIASEGVLTIGSPATLREVLRTAGTPVASAKDEIRR